MASFVQAGYWICGSRYLIRSVEDHIPNDLFTHLYAGFAEVNANDGTVTVPLQYKDQFRTFTDKIRARSSQVKTLLSIGGEGSHISPVVADADKRKTFISTSIDLARSFHFDGLDLCWLYPSRDDNPDNLELLLKDWRNAVTDDAKKRKLQPLLLTAEVFHHPVISNQAGIGEFKYPDISKYLDWINVLAVDFYTPSNLLKKTGPVHAWHTAPTEPNKRCGSHGIGNWIDYIPQTQKLVLSLAFYGYEWILDNPDISSGYFAPAHPAENKNPISYRNIPRNVSPTRNATYLSSYIVKDKSWFGYDEADDISGKLRDAIGNHNLGGYLAWHVGADDDNWTLSHAASIAVMATSIVKNNQ